MPTHDPTETAQEAVRFARAEFGVELEPDDPFVVGYALQLKAARDSEERFRQTALDLLDRSATEAVEKAVGAHREAMQRQLEKIERIVDGFEGLSQDAHRFAHDRQMFADISSEIARDVKPILSSMNLTRQAIDRSRPLNMPVKIIAFLGVSMLVFGIGIGLTIGTMV